MSDNENNIFSEEEFEEIKADLKPFLEMRKAEFDRPKTLVVNPMSLNKAESILKFAKRFASLPENRNENVEIKKDCFDQQSMRISITGDLLSRIKPFLENVISLCDSICIYPSPNDRIQIVFVIDNFYVEAK